MIGNIDTKERTVLQSSKTLTILQQNPAGGSHREGFVKPPAVIQNVNGLATIAEGNQGANKAGNLSILVLPNMITKTNDSFPTQNESSLDSSKNNSRNDLFSQHFSSNVSLSKLGPLLSVLPSPDSVSYTHLTLPTKA